MSERVAIVTGGNRGIGREVCRQLAERGYQVILTSRDAQQGEMAAGELAKSGANIIAHKLDVTDASGISALAAFVRREFGRADALINNAGILPSEDRKILDTDLAVFERVLDANTLGPLRLTQAILPLMIERNYGRVVNVSSGMGALDDLSADYPAYRLSKAALNALTLMFADAARGRDILVNAVDPGWVKTRMGGSGATRTVEQGADTIVWAATLERGGPTGKFLRDRREVGW